MNRFFLAFSWLAILVFARTSLDTSMTEKAARETVPVGFRSLGAASPSQMLDLRIGLVSRNISGLEDALYAVSTPSNARYGLHLSNEELKSFMAPTDESIQTVSSWLTSHDLQAKTASLSGEWLSLSLTVEQANELLDAQYENFVHISSGSIIGRTMSYSLPSAVAGYIDVVHPTTSFGSPVVIGPLVSAPTSHSLGSFRRQASTCNTTITPACLQALYNIPSTPATQASNQIAVSGFSEEFAQEADLHTFLQNLRPDINPNTNFSTQSVNDGLDPQGGTPGVEADLDTQYTVGVATNVSVTFVSVGNNASTTADLATAFLDITNFLLSEPNRPHVMTTSYGGNEVDVPMALAVKLCNAYMALGAAGTSVINSSGDGGVAGHRDTPCTTFVPTFPSICPFLTSVGATVNVPESAAALTGGGFSNYFATPSYQRSAVQAYQESLGSTFAGLFNTSGRGYPDVSAQGQRVEIFVSGTAELVAGTSCSAPIFAATIGLINDRLIAAGRPPLGFLNPFLYANPSAFNDITTGSNPGCNTTGFPAITGWDPVSGLGTPNFPALLAAVGLEDITLGN